MVGCRAGGRAIVGSCSASVLVCHTSTYLPGRCICTTTTLLLALGSPHDSSMHATQGGIGSGLVPSLRSDRGACVSCRRGRIGKTSRNTRMITGMPVPPHSALTLQGAGVSPDLPHDGPQGAGERGRHRSHRRVCSIYLTTARLVLLLSYPPPLSPSSSALLLLSSP